MPDEILWSEDDKCIRVYYNHEEFGYHGKTSGKEFYVELKRCEEMSSQVTWENSDLPCECQTVLKKESMMDRPFDGFERKDEKERILKNLLRTAAFWKLTESSYSYRF